MTPTGYSPAASSIDDAAGLRADLPVARFARSAAVPVSAPGPWTEGDFEVRCADVHPTGCDRTLRAQRPGDVVELAREHGALVHGFTPAYYSKQRLAIIAAAIGLPVTERAADDAHRAADGHRGRTRQGATVTLSHDTR